MTSANATAPGPTLSVTERIDRLEALVAALCGAISVCVPARSKAGPEIQSLLLEISDQLAPSE